ncbi:MAG TPA: hypothetical protein VNF68_08960 [Candidatus Baltobacteraceae bacterium]|nr:hypothetical protein [Candidatus Baltobacteraceae bacterium]
MKKLGRFYALILGACALIGTIAIPVRALATQINNPLPNRVWITVYAQGGMGTRKIVQARWLDPRSSYTYHNSYGSYWFRAEIAKMGDERPHPAVICDTRIEVPTEKSADWITIHLNGNCWWTFGR